MKRTTLSKHIEAFRTETTMVLRFQFALTRISKFNDINQFSRSEFVDKLISLKSIENDLVLRICKFGDGTKGVHSFLKAKNEIPSAYPHKQKILEKIELFSRTINRLQKERRHTQLAHLKIGIEDNDYEIRYNLTPAIKLIVEIVDLMNNAVISYSWSDGRYEKFDLKKEVLNEGS